MGDDICYFFPATFWFFILPDIIIPLTIAHLIAYYVVTLLLFRNKIEKSVREYIIKNKINAYPRSYSGHFGFLTYFGLPVWIASLVVHMFFIPFYTTLPNDVPEMFWEPLMAAYVILSVVSLNLPYVITMFLVAYVIGGLIFCNEKIFRCFFYYMRGISSNNKDYQ
ncbi:hypothetical protein M1M92_02140 [Peptococcaceae bacterium]|nr:hypothetical protein [Peptococcaceae bacterium]